MRDEFYSLIILLETATWSWWPDAWRIMDAIQNEENQ